MSKIDKLVEDTAAIKEHCRGCATIQAEYLREMREVKVRVTSLEDTRTFQKGMLKLATILTIATPTLGALFVKGWKFLQHHKFVP